MTFTPPATADECETAMEACFSKAIGLMPSDAALVWLDRYKALRQYGADTWPEQFPPVEDAPDTVDL